MSENITLALPSKVFFTDLSYPAASRPVAYIVANCKGADLAELIAHEAYHVYLYRHGRQSESGARDYGQRVKQDLLNIT